jgi:DNA-directed RNA polymerase II subunit RPB2
LILQAINIISQIKHSTIEQGINSALATGTWGNSKKKGVAQMLQRLTYMQLISSLRRVITPQGDASSKVDRMRYVHNTQYGFIDAIETPEHGHNVGTVKQLSNPATITVNSASQPEIIKGILENQILELTDLEPIKLKLYTRVFLNGEWLGMTDQPVKLTAMLKSKRFTGDIERFVSIAHNFNTKEIKINTDAGRLVRPLLRVENNKLVLTDKMIDEINILNKTDPTKIHRWNDFLMKFPNAVEYVDPEEQETLMISFWVKDVEAEYTKMITPVEAPNAFGNSTNRYNETVYKRYTHCEFHPSMTCGNISANAPFSEHNDAPRNYFNFSQARQALGIYSSNYRHRVDLAYNLYNPQVPLVYPRTSKYTGMLNLPYGENCVVAIAMYTGYNQEDSILMNQSSIERGLFRAESYKKDSDEISKNPATGQDETFGKPDRNKVAGMKDGNYEKLNDKGFIPEETKVKNNDVLFGKLTPVQPGEASNKIFKDSSLMYKGGVDGVVDRVYTGIKNADGYDMYNMRIRQERVPRGGDKFSSRHGQKGTIGTTMRAEDMPFTADGIRPDIVINTCCIPSRMTVGQLLEALVSKSAALEGQTVETTQFERVDMNEIGDILETHGFERHGLETMYCGFTGKKMEAQIFICPTYYLRLKHLVQDKIHCLDSKHDVLTLDGWKPIAEITLNDKVATLENNKLVYAHPTNVLHYPDHEGKMSYIKNQALD